MERLLADILLWWCFSSAITGWPLIKSNCTIRLIILLCKKSWPCPGVRHVTKKSVLNQENLQLQFVKLLLGGRFNYLNCYGKCTAPSEPMCIFTELLSLNAGTRRCLWSPSLPCIDHPWYSHKLRVSQLLLPQALDGEPTAGAIWHGCLPNTPFLSKRQPTRNCSYM